MAKSTERESAVKSLQKKETEDVMLNFTCFVILLFLCYCFLVKVPLVKESVLLPLMKNTERQ